MPRGGKLYVEGSDDEWTIVNLLQRHGVDMTTRPLEVCSIDETMMGAAGVEALLEFPPDATRASLDAPIGFILDIDTELSDRWAAVRARLITAGLEPPANCPREGYVAQLPEYPHPAGVWLMPDCRSDHGTLEDFLQRLIPAEEAALWAHARAATGDAVQIGAEFPSSAVRKAELHCWLAWQRVPGTPFGLALKARFLGHDSPEALALLGWLRRVFGL